MAAAIRRLRSSDRNDIVEISSHIWEGHDYLSSVVDEWLRDAKSRFYGVEVGGRVVAVGRLRLVEGGRIGWMEGLRVHPEYRGRGFANDITRCIVREGECLGVERLRYTTSDENAASVKLAKMAGFSRILRMAVSWHYKLEHVATLIDHPPIQRQSPERTCDLLEANPRILPHGILVYEWKALDNTCPNVKEIGKTHTFYAALRRRKLNSLSISSSGQEPDEPYWGFTVCAVDSSGFLAQFSYNVATALKHDIDSIACTFETRFEKALDGVGLKSEEDHKTHLVLFEKRMRRRKTEELGSARS
ncbi:MAG TPA: GNAT family N-acetyltransferase [candidate division Zixibacteria bacterium]|nr:GNAT family N-acetyltransferase [candidate division Zixibacteria bacterium]